MFSMPTRQLVKHAVRRASDEANMLYVKVGDKTLPLFWTAVEYMSLGDHRLRRRFILPACRAFSTATLP